MQFSPATQLGFVLVFVALLLQFVQIRRRRPASVYVDGFVEENFLPVLDAFRKNLEDGWERGGGAFAVYHRGRKVVDVWGGWADKETERLWRNDTLSVAFSCTKAFGAIVVAQLVDRKILNYDDPVTKFWPEFGQNGKENVTVGWLIGHKAGLAYTDHPVPREFARSPELIDRIFEKQAPNWPPGTEIGYHAVTFGWLVDAIVRRADPKRRSVGTYFREEIASKFGIDFYIGLPPHEQRRVSRITTPTVYETLDEFLHSPNEANIIPFFWDNVSNGTQSKLFHATPWIQFILKMTLNDPDLHAIEQSAVLGIGTARAMAEVFELLRTGKLLSPEGTKRLLKDFETRTDFVTGAVAPRGQGLMLKQFEHNGKQVKLYGHSGYGGQNVRTDWDNAITIAYMSNALKIGFGDTARTYKRLLTTVYDVVLQNE